MEREDRIRIVKDMIKSWELTQEEVFPKEKTKNENYIKILELINPTDKRIWYNIENDKFHPSKDARYALEPLNTLLANNYLINKVETNNGIFTLGDTVYYTSLEAFKRYFRLGRIIKASPIGGYVVGTSNIMEIPKCSIISMKKDTNVNKEIALFTPEQTNAIELIVKRVLNS